MAVEWLSCIQKANEIPLKFIRSADPQSRPVVIIVFTHVRWYVRPTFQNLAKQNKFQAKTIVTSTGENVGLAEWIINDTCHLWFLF